MLIMSLAYRALSAKPRMSTPNIPTHIRNMRVTIAHERRPETKLPDLSGAIAFVHGFAALSERGVFSGRPFRSACERRNAPELVP